MHSHSAPSDFAVAIAGLALISLISISPLYNATKQVVSKRQQKDHSKSLYQDEDGDATPESQKSYADLLPRLILVIISTVGTVASALFLAGSYTGALCFLTGDKYSCQRRHDSIWIEQCFILPSWILLLTQSCIVFRTRHSVQRFHLGLYGAASSAVLAAALSIQTIQWTSRKIVSSNIALHATLLLIECAFAFISAAAFLLLPRRPDVYQDGKLVDRQFTVSAWTRVTFGWVNPILAFTSKNSGITSDDLPVISHDVRAHVLRSRYDSVGKQDKVWKVIFFAHQRIFITQWCMQIIQSFANFFPQLTLYAILKALEARDKGHENHFQLWLLVIALGVSDAFFSWTENWLYFISFIKLGNSLFEMISATVFAKAVRRKDVKGVSKSNDTEGKPNAETIINEDAGPKGEDTIKETDEGEDITKTKQGTINLIGVDAKRVSDFSVYNAMLLGCVLKLTIAMVLLVGLMGWIPVLSGFSILLFIGPVNWWIAKRYSVAQDDLMKFRDQKLAVVTEALQGIRQIKFSALEKDWYEKILKSRKKELRTQWHVFVYDTILISLWIFGPVCLSAISLAVYALINKELSPSIAFTTISIFESIEVTLGVAPELITDLLDALISCQRIQEYLDSPDRSDDLKPGEKIAFQNATISWPTDEKDVSKDEEVFKLHNLDLEFPPGELSVVSGKTGSGKSLLLASIIGEADIIAGDIYVPRAPPTEQRFDHKANKKDWLIKDAIAFVAQIPWIENATIKDNILFSLPFDKDRYRKVLHASALEKDMEMLQDGDMTDIGANGINLSGGQKWRVSFARALYSRAGILVLDDIFSAVDAHVGKHLFEEALTGELGRDRTRILVTHHVALCLPKTTYSILLDNGTVVHAGLTDDLRRNGLLKEILAYDVEEQHKEDQKQNMTIDNGGSLQITSSPLGGRARRESGVTIPEIQLTRTKSTASDTITRDKPKKFTEDEGRATGAVKLSVYKAYIGASGGIKYWSLIIVIFIIWSATFLGRSYWISIWTRASGEASQRPVALYRQSANSFHSLKQDLISFEVDRGVFFYVSIYLGISLGQWLVGTTKYLFVYIASIRASKRLFEDLANTILRAPLRFLDTTPLGRILNRFTSDFNMVDSRISYDIMFCMHSGVSTLAVVAAGAFISPAMLGFALILFLVCTWYARRYLSGAREAKRLESIAKSPIFEQFGSVLQGIGTIRAFDKAEEYITRMESRINRHCQAYYHMMLFSRWMSLRVSWVGAGFLTAMAALIVGIRDIDAPLAGFALSFSLQLSECIIWVLRQYANVELDLNAVERVVEYSKMPIEDQSGHDAPAAWPTKGELEVNDLVVAYASDLAPVLKGLTFSVKQNERVGVVGRTGAGKSSLTLALFRFLDYRSGSVWIDGIDISKIKLSDLRSRLAIIPQDPVLFSGTVRSNLDPFDQHSDTELRDALARVQLIPSASTISSGIATPSNEGTSSTSSTLGQGASNINLFKSLSSKIAEGGLNLSQGQRQLLCLARAIVSRPKILVLDEATSSVDMETDALIQRSIREEFSDCTLMVIAHRLSTIADFDRILVLGDGRVVEYDQPETLMDQEKSAFRDMVESSGERRELEAVIKEKHQR